MAAKKKNSTALVAVKRGALKKIKDEEGLHDSAVVTGRVASDWPMISTGGATFTLGDEKNTELEVVIVGSAFVNAYFSGPYDPDNIASPDCWAIGGKEDELAPPETLTTKESAKCEGCDMNAFGSANTGKGKACKNMLRLACLPVTDGAVDVKKGKGFRLNVSPTQVKKFSTYVAELRDEYNMPVEMALTQISVAPDPKTQIALEFEAVGQALSLKDAKVVRAREDVRDALHRGYEANADAPAKPATKVKKKRSSRAKERTVA